MTTSHHRRHEADEVEPDPIPQLNLPGGVIFRACRGALFIDTSPGTAVQVSILLAGGSAHDLRDFLNKHYGDTDQT